MKMTIRKVVLCISVVTVLFGGVLCGVGIWFGADIDRALNSMGINAEWEYNHDSYYNNHDEIDEFMKEFGIDNYMEGNNNEETI